MNWVDAIAWAVIALYILPLFIALVGVMVMIVHDAWVDDVFGWPIDWQYYKAMIYSVFMSVMPVLNIVAAYGAVRILYRGFRKQL